MSLLKRIEQGQGKPTSQSGGENGEGSPPWGKRSKRHISGP